MPRQGNSDGRAFLLFFDRRSGRFLLCRPRRRTQAKKPRRTVWRRGFHWSRHARFDNLIRRASVTRPLSSPHSRHGGLDHDVHSSLAYSQEPFVALGIPSRFLWASFAVGFISRRFRISRFPDRKIEWRQAKETAWRRPVALLGVRVAMEFRWIPIAPPRYGTGATAVAAPRSNLACRDPTPARAAVAAL